MSLHRTVSWWRPGRSRPATGAVSRPAPPAHVRPQLEHLEDRRVLTAFTNQAYVASLYRGLLDRDPEQGGLSLWSGLLDSGQSFTQVAGSIINSPEYQLRQVEDVYEHALNRQADPLGLAAWGGLLQQGQTIEQVKAGIYSSDEFFTRAGGSPQGFLDILFQNELQRSPTASDLGVLGPNLTTPGQRAAVAQAVLSSPEAGQVRVANFYRGLLDRNPDPAGQAFWASQLSAGARDESVLAAFLGSDEYLLRLQNAIDASPSTDPVQVGDAFTQSTNRLSGSVVGAPSPALNTANSTQFVSFSITPNGTPFGPLRFTVLTPAVLATTPLTASFAPSTQTLLSGVPTTQNIATGFGAFPTVTTTTTLAPGVTALPGTNPAATTVNIAPGFTQAIASPFTGNITPGLTTVAGMPTTSIGTGFNQSLLTSGTGFASAIPAPVITSSPILVGTGLI